MPHKPIRKSAQTAFISASLLLVGTLSLQTCSTASAQGITTGTIIGSAVDASGAVMANAKVTATRADTGTVLKLTTDQKGEFSFRNVPAGTYTVTIEEVGFEAAKLGNVRVDAGQTNDLGATQIAVGPSATTVEVTESTGTLLQTTESQISTTFSTLQTEDLPLNGNLDNIALFTPGVVQGHDDSFSNSNGQNLSINGNRSRSNNYEIDGQSNNDNSVGGPQIFFANQDALQEVQIITSNFNAVYGRNTGGVVNYITKAGTNRFHGTGYEFFNGDFLQAFSNGYKNPLLGFCAPGQDPATTGCSVPYHAHYVDNRYGGTFGGPVLKDKVWFFGGTNFEHTRQGFTPLITSTTTPTPAGLQALAAAFPGNPAVATLQASGPYAVLNAVHPSGTTTLQNVTGPGGATAINVPFSSISTSVAPIYRDQEDLGRIDWQPTEKDHLFLRYIYQNTESDGNLQGNGYYYNVPSATHSVGADWAHTFSSTWVDQLRYSFQQSKLFFQGGTQPSCVSTSLSDCVAQVTIASYEGFGYDSNLPQGRTVKVTQVQDNANWTHGAHSVSFGGDFTYQNSPNTFLPTYNGAYAYADFNSFIQDTGSLNLGNGNPVIPFTEGDFGFYGQDDWKVSPSLTLNLGFRYEFFGQAVNKLHTETVAQQTGPNPFWSTALPLSTTTYPYTNPNYKNLEPRLGFAYNPTSLKKLVVRGAYGIQYDPSFYNIFLNSASAAPVINQGTITCAGNCLPGGAATGVNVRAFDLPRLPTGGNPNASNLTNNPSTFVNPRVQNFNLGMQYELHNAVVGLSYVGNHVSRQFLSVDSNPYLLPVAQAFPNVVAPSSLCSTAGALGAGRLNCNQTNVETRNNNAFSIYNSLQAQLQTRQYHGATINASYTYSRIINNSDEIFSANSPAGTSSSPAFAQNPLQTDTPERGVANFSYPNEASIAINYVIPAYKAQRGLIGRVLGGYEVSTGWTANSGEPWTASQFNSAAFSSTTNAGGTALASAAAIALNTTSYCDGPFSSAYNNSTDTCRPVVLNPGAPLTSVGVYVNDPLHQFSTNGTGYYAYRVTNATGQLTTPVSANQVHWLYNNQAYANLVGNPFPGSPRNVNRGQSFDNLDAAIIKNLQIREGVGVKLYLNAFNVLNHQYLGNPNTTIDDAAFGTTTFNTGNYNNPGGGGVPASRYLQIGGKVTF